MYPMSSLKRGLKVLLLCSGFAMIAPGGVWENAAHARASSHSSRSSGFSSSHSTRVFTPRSTPSAPSRSVQMMNEKASSDAFRAFDRNRAGAVAAGVSIGAAAGSVAHAEDQHQSSTDTASPSGAYQANGTTSHAPSERVEGSLGDETAKPPSQQAQSESDSQNRRVRRDPGDGYGERRSSDRVVIVHDHSNSDSGYMNGLIAGTLLGASSERQSELSEKTAPASAPVPSVGMSHDTASEPAAPIPSPMFDTAAEPHHSLWGLALFLLLGLGLCLWLFIDAVKRRSGIKSVRATLKAALIRKIGKQPDKTASGRSTPIPPPLPSLPTIVIGAEITVPGMATSSDPVSDQPCLDFEPDFVGQTSIVGIGVFSRSEGEDMASLYTNHELSDHVRICFDPHTQGEVTDAIFFTEVSPHYTNSESEWAVWLDPNDGLMGQPDIEHDGKKWTRSILPQDERRLEPVEEHEHIITMLPNGERSVASWVHKYTLYERQTGYSDGYPAIEYMMIRSCSRHGEGDEGLMFLQVLGGVPLPVSSLNLS